MSKLMSIITSLTRSSAKFCFVFFLGWAGFTAVAQTQSLSRELPQATTFSGNYLSGIHAAENLDADAVVVYLKRALLEDPFNSGIIRQIVFLEMMRGNFDGARPYAINMVEKNLSGQNLAQLFLGVDDFAQDQFKASIDTFDNLIEKTVSDDRGDPFTSFASTVLASWAELAHGKGDQAIDRLESFDAIPGFNFIKSYHVALLNQTAGKQKAAEKAFKQALRANPQSSRLIDAYSRFLARENRKNDALKVIGDFKKANNELLPSLIEILEQSINSDADIAPLVGDPREGMTEALYNLGLFITTQGGQDLAILLYRLGLSVTPQFDVAEFALANAFQRIEQYDVSTEIYDKIQRQSPLWRSAQIEVANNWRLLEEPENAKTSLMDLLSKDENDLQVLLAMGNLLRSEQDFATAATFYSRAVDLLEKPEPSDWRVFYYRGIAYERSKQWDKAEIDFKQSLTLNPDEPDVLNYLGYSWVDQNLNLDEALDMIRRAVELNPRNGFIVDSLGWAYYKLGRYEEAAVELEKAVTLMPSDPILNDHLGDAFWKVGRKREARFQWSHALTMEPEEEDRVRIEEKLKSGLIESADALKSDDAENVNATQ